MMTPINCMFVGKVVETEEKLGNLISVFPFKKDSPKKRFNVLTKHRVSEKLFKKLISDREKVNEMTQVNFLEYEEGSSDDLDKINHIINVKVKKQI